MCLNPQTVFEKIESYYLLNDIFPIRIRIKNKRHLKIDRLIKNIKHVIKMICEVTYFGNEINKIVVKIKHI